MPLYDFSCQNCGDFRTLLTIDERNDPVACPSCSRASRRLILAPNLALMNPLGRKAASINEKSRHEPRMSGEHSCGSSCGCGTTSTKIKKNHVRETALGTLQSQKPSARPWMLGH